MIFTLRSVRSMQGCDAARPSQCLSLAMIERSYGHRESRLRVKTKEEKKKRNVCEGMKACNTRN